jgi:hypothetical protein
MWDLAPVKFTWTISFLPLTYSNYFAKEQIYCCETVKPSRRAMSQDLGSKKINLKQGDIHVRTRVT